MSVPSRTVSAMAYPTTHPAEAADASVVDLSGASCPRLTAPGEVARRLAALDDRYIRDEFVPLDELAADWPGGAVAVRADMAARRLPQPAYRLDDGTDMVPADYLEPVAVAGSVAALRAWFVREFRDAATRFDVPHDPETIESEWQDYLSGGYFVCLRHATPAAMAEKARHIIDLEHLLAEPRPADQVWCKRLRLAVHGLAAIERPFAILDPARWGTPMSGQWYGTFLRALYPAALSSESGAP
jgi:hypothetical protein